MTLNFTINSSFKSFNDKQKSLFDQLAVAEKNSKNVLSDNTMPTDEIMTDDVDDRSATRKQNTKKFSGQESIFKKPQTRAPKNFVNRRIPDYWKNPSKWTKYSLADVPNEDMSDRSNTAAAMAFLKEIQDRKRVTEQGEDEPMQELPKKVAFRKIVKSSTDANTSTAVFQNSKWLMPEYVIGQKNIKNKHKKVSNNSTSKNNKEIKLGHLLEEN